MPSNAPSTTLCGPGTGLGLDYVETPRLSRILAKVDKLRGSRGRTDSDIMVIKGPAGSGKTSMLNHFARQYPDSRDALGPIRPIVFARVSGQCTWRSLAKSILTALNVTPPKKASEDDIVAIIVAQLAGQRVQVLILEDTQRICSDAKAYRAGELIDDICEDGRTPIVIAGKTKVEKLLTHNDSLRRRTTFSETLWPLNWSVPAERAEFQRVIQMLTQAWTYPVADFSFGDKDTAARMHWAHGGLFGNVVQHMRAVEKDVEIRLDAGEDRGAQIYLADLSRIYLEMRAEGQIFKQFIGNDNPFDAKAALPRKWALASMYD